MRISDWSSDVCSSDLIPARKSWWDPALRRDLTSLHFVRLVAATLIIAIVSMALIINLVPILRSNGLSLTTAAAIGGIVGITQIIGRLSAGLLLDPFDEIGRASCRERVCQYV